MSSMALFRRKLEDSGSTGKVSQRAWVAGVPDLRGVYPEDLRLAMEASLRVARRSQPHHRRVHGGDRENSDNQEDPEESGMG